MEGAVVRARSFFWLDHNMLSRMDFLRFLRMAGSAVAGGPMQQ
jgi:hypothetical protein